MKKFLGLLLIVFALFFVSACEDPIDDPDDGLPDPSEIDYDSNVDLNVAINYQLDGALASISYQKDTAYVSTIDGQTYTKGSLLPAWERIGEKLNITFTDGAQSSDPNTNAQFTRLQTESFAGVDLVNGTGALIGPEGVRGNFVDIGKYLDYMPNLKAFLDANPAVKVSMSSADGGIYFTPYFDGFSEQEQMFLARLDWVKDILDLETPAFDQTAATVPTLYTRKQVPTPIDVNITVANADGTTRIVNKAYATNILDVFAGLVNPTGADLANALRAHMEATYGDQGYAKLSDVFIGTDASYDTDELVALMYVVKSNPEFLTRQHPTPKTEVEVMFPREGKGSRIRNLFRGLEMYGLRGMHSRHEWMYFDEEGNVQDARHDQSFIDAVNDLSDMYNDGIIVQNPEDYGNWRTLLLQNSNGFITFDYNATSTASGLINSGRNLDPDLEFQAILPPVVDWLGDGNYFHFTESVRSVKNEAWGIPSHVEADQTKLFRALRLVDELYDYETEDSVGTVHLYGPTGWTDGTLAYGTDTVYQLSDLALQEMATLTGGDHIKYLRAYVGATMPIGHIRSLGLEFQTLTDQGQEGITRLNTAISAGVLKLAGQVDSDNPWYGLSPTFFPLTEDEYNMIEAAAGFRDIFQDNVLITMVKYGFSGLGGSTSEENYWNMFMLNDVDIYDVIYIKSYRAAYVRSQE